MRSFGGTLAVVVIVAELGCGSRTLDPTGEPPPLGQRRDAAADVGPSDAVAAVDAQRRDTALDLLPPRDATDAPPVGVDAGADQRSVDRPPGYDSGAPDGA